MNKYTLSSETAKLLKLHKKVTFEDVAELSAPEIEKYNSSEPRNKRAFRKLYKPSSENITTETFVIPVADASITGYLFRNKTVDTNNGPLIIYLHDGGWMFGNMESCKAFCSNVCRATKSTILALDYRLSPMFKFPIPIEDCYNACLWASLGAKYWKTDPERIYLMGTCTGANLAIAVSRIARDRKGPKIAGIILEDPLTDCRLKTESIMLHENNPSLPKHNLDFFIQNYQREPKDILDPLFSPLLSLDHSRMPQTLIFSSELSPLSDDALLYACALKTADTPVKVIKMKERMHSFIKYPNSERWSDQMDAISSFISGKPVLNVDLLTKRQRARLNRKKPKMSVSSDYPM